MPLELIHPTCNMDTVTDGRGGIFTWVPPDKLAEFNLLYFQPGKSRGHHFHPEFVEYFLVVSGSGVMVTRKSKDSPQKIIHMSRGSCTRATIGTPHAFYAITPVTAVAMLSKEWDKCKEPIIREDVVDNPKK